ncbi:MAG: alpha/beta fold hydrolase [Patescibacteria group bacterium]|nr:alpha/beta fold hydrolase [Patescibacteria group bacterium]
MKQENNNFLENSKPFYFSGNKVGVILIHGFTGSPADLRVFGRYLAKQGYTVKGIRLTGHGIHHTVLKKTNRYDWYYSLKRSINEIRDQVEEIFLVGFSMGGDLSILYNEMEKGVKGMVLINTPIYTKPSRLTFWFIPLIKRFKKFKIKGWAKKTDNYFEKRCACSYTKIPLDSAWQFYKLVQESKAVAEKIKIPVYLIQSRHDQAINAESVNFLDKKIKTVYKKDIINTHLHGLLSEYEKRENIYSNINDFIKKSSKIV